MNFKYVIKISSNNLSVLLYLFIVTIPYSNTPILVLCLALIICLEVAWRKNLNLTLYESSHDYLLTLLLALILIWNQYYLSSLNSDQAWKSSLNKTVYPLTGDNVEIVPPFEDGYLLDSTCIERVENEYGYFETNFQTLKVKKSDSLVATVYCFVSKDFNGDSVRLLIKGAVYGNRVSDFKLSDTNDEKLSFAGNLISNGDFKLGTANWITDADSTTHAIIETPFGSGIRVSRTNGDGGSWSLRYMGRPIIYNAGHKYQIRFLYKIEKGSGIPFNIGWWVNEGNGFVGSNLPLEIIKMRDGWNEATCSYVFNQTHYNMATFLNSLQDFSIIDITNIEMTDLDRNDTLPLFVDQINKKGTWQKLTVKVPCYNGLASVSFRISRNNVLDFRFLKGYVIFALPQWNK